MSPSYLITDYGAAPDIEALQTETIQKVFDLCRDHGGTVVVPRGRFRISGLRMWSDTTLYLQTGAELVGSDICEDYPVFDVPENVELRTDMELITQYYENRPWKEYRRAMISVYGGKNIAVIGEPGSVIDGDDCADPHGEEGYRGPHGLFLTNIEGMTLRGYTIRNCGNFMHQVDNCKHITVKNVTCEGGSDGIHLHHCVDTLIEDCVFHTGDDCVAGINMENLTVRNCGLKTCCDAFRAGGSHILVENCHIWGPGIFPHRMTVVQNRYTDLVRDKSNTLPRECGRHNLITVYLHFASTNFPSPEPYHDVVMRNCKIENVGRFLSYHADCGPLESGTHLTEMTLEDVTFENLLSPSDIAASKEEPLTVTMRNVVSKEVPVFDGRDPNTKLR
ncbi:MAG: right-handed parallel beta-helix repeat-containing protein [Clostridia bacterium]|nr:right-handed parallel beta-helix repeat-containing protein [Clostridia bacterium]